MITIAPDDGMDMFGCGEDDFAVGRLQFAPIAGDSPGVKDFADFARFRLDFIAFE